MRCSNSRKKTHWRREKRSNGKTEAMRRAEATGGIKEMLSGREDENFIVSLDTAPLLFPAPPPAGRPQWFPLHRKPRIAFVALGSPSSRFSGVLSAEGGISPPAFRKALAIFSLGLLHSLHSNCWYNSGELYVSQ